MIAVDTNVLVYAHRIESEFCQPAAAAIRRLPESPEQWAIPWPCLHEFFAVVTHPAIFRVSSLVEAAISQIEIWRESPSLKLIGESGEYWRTLGEILTQGKIAGPKVHDARIAAICRVHGIRELWSADRDFSRMRGLKVTNPVLHPTES